MLRRPRRDRVPAEVAAEMSPRERVLASATDRQGRWQGATDQALHIADASGRRRLPWQRVDRASWDRDSERLVVVEVAGFGMQQPTFEVELTEPGRLLEVVRERVTASVLLTRHIPVSGSRGMKVVARRPPDGRGEIDWSFWLAADLDPTDPAVQQAAERGLAEAQAELGV